MATIYCNSEATGLNDGSSWDNAFTTLINALTYANINDNTTITYTLVEDITNVTGTDLVFFIQEGINGKYEIDRYGDIFFLPYRSNNKKMPLHFTSSTVKTLFSLVFYLEHLAQPGDYLMIDEPELSLHPDNQRNLARVLAKLVNKGVKVVLSTHSPYFVRELNNLIMLNKSFIKASELRQRYAYEPGESLNPEKVSAYLFDQKTIKEMEIDPNEGIIAETFDNVINNLNRSSNDIYYASQEEEDCDNE
jgi:predicted ATPase